MVKHSTRSRAHNKGEKMAEKAVEQRSVSVMDVPVKSVKAEKDWNLRTSYVEIDELAASMSADGMQQQPIIVAKLADGSGYSIIDGFRRYYAIKKLGWDTIRVQVIQVADMADARAINLSSNLQRDNLSSYEIATGLADLAKVGNMPAHGRGVQIAKRLGFTGEGKRLSPTTINNLLRAVENLIPEALRAWSKGQISQDAAFSLAAREKDEQGKWLPKLKGLSGDALRDKIDDLDNPIDPADSIDGEGDGEKSEKTKRPGRARIKKALVWCRENGYEEAEATLRWACGDLKTLTIDGNRFDPNAKKPEEEADAAAQEASA